MAVLLEAAKAGGLAHRSCAASFGCWAGVADSRSLATAASSLRSIVGADSPTKLKKSFNSLLTDRRHKWRLPLLGFDETQRRRPLLHFPSLPHSQSLSTRRSNVSFIFSQWLLIRIAILSSFCFTIFLKYNLSHVLKRWTRHFDFFCMAACSVTHFHSCLQNDLRGGVLHLVLG